METTITEWAPSVSRVMIKLVSAGLLTVWCLFAVNWRKAWPVLAAGGWMPLVLIGLMTAAVWSRVFPEALPVPGIGTIANGIWQYFAVGILIGVVLFCGWLQSRWGYTPEEFNLDEPAHGHDDHGHHDAHH